MTESNNLVVWENSERQKRFRQMLNEKTKLEFYNAKKTGTALDRMVNLLEAKHNIIVYQCYVIASESKHLPVWNPCVGLPLLTWVETRDDEARETIMNTITPDIAFITEKSKNQVKKIVKYVEIKSSRRAMEAFKKSDTDKYEKYKASKVKFLYPEDRDYMEVLTGFSEMVGMKMTQERVPETLMEIEKEIQAGIKIFNELRSEGEENMSIEELIENFQKRAFNNKRIFEVTSKIAKEILDPNIKELVKKYENIYDDFENPENHIRREIEMSKIKKYDFTELNDAGVLNKMVSMSKNTVENTTYTEEQKPYLFFLPSFSKDLIENFEFNKFKVKHLNFFNEVMVSMEKKEGTLLGEIQPYFFDIAKSSNYIGDFDTTTLKNDTTKGTEEELKGSLEELKKIRDALKKRVYMSDKGKEESNDENLLTDEEVEFLNNIQATIEDTENELGKKAEKEEEKKKKKGRKLSCKITGGLTMNIKLKVLSKTGDLHSKIQDYKGQVVCGRMITEKTTRNDLKFYRKEAEKRIRKASKKEELLDAFREYYKIGNLLDNKKIDNDLEEKMAQVKDIKEVKYTESGLEKKRMSYKTTQKVKRLSEPDFFPLFKSEGKNVEDDFFSDEEHRFNISHQHGGVVGDIENLSTKSVFNFEMKNFISRFSRIDSAGSLTEKKKMREIIERNNSDYFKTNIFHLNNFTETAAISLAYASSINTDKFDVTILSTTEKHTFIIVLGGPSFDYSESGKAYYVVGLTDMNKTFKNLLNTNYIEGKNYKVYPLNKGSSVSVFEIGPLRIDKYRVNELLTISHVNMAMVGANNISNNCDLMEINEKERFQKLMTMRCLIGLSPKTEISYLLSYYRYCFTNSIAERSLMKELLDDINEIHIRTKLGSFLKAYLLRSALSFHKSLKEIEFKHSENETLEFPIKRDWFTNARFNSEEVFFAQVFSEYTMPKHLQSNLREYWVTHELKYEKATEWWELQKKKPESSRGLIKLSEMEKNESYVFSADFTLACMKLWDLKSKESGSFIERLETKVFEVDLTKFATNKASFSMKDLNILGAVVFQEEDYDYVITEINKKIDSMIDKEIMLNKVLSGKRSNTKIIEELENIRSMLKTDNEEKEEKDFDTEKINKMGNLERLKHCASLNIRMMKDENLLKLLHFLWNKRYINNPGVQRTRNRKCFENVILEFFETNKINISSNYPLSEFLEHSWDRYRLINFINLSIKDQRGNPRHFGSTNLSTKAIIWLTETAVIEEMIKPMENEYISEGRKGTKLQEAVNMFKKQAKEMERKAYEDILGEYKAEINRKSEMVENVQKHAEETSVSIKQLNENLKIAENKPVFLKAVNDFKRAVVESTKWSDYVIRYFNEDKSKWSEEWNNYKWLMLYVYLKKKNLRCADFVLLFFHVLSKKFILKNGEARFVNSPGSFDFLNKNNPFCNIPDELLESIRENLRKKGFSKDYYKEYKTDEVFDVLYQTLKEKNYIANDFMMGYANKGSSFFHAIMGYALENYYDGKTFEKNSIIYTVKVKLVSHSDDSMMLIAYPKIIEEIFLEDFFKTVASFHAAFGFKESVKKSNFNKMMEFVSIFGLDGSPISLELAKIVPSIKNNLPCTSYVEDALAVSSQIVNMTQRGLNVTAAYWTEIVNGKMLSKLWPVENSEDRLSYFGGELDFNPSILHARANDIRYVSFLDKHLGTAEATAIQKQLTKINPEDDILMNSMVEDNVFERSIKNPIVTRFRNNTKIDVLRLFLHEKMGKETIDEILSLGDKYPFLKNIKGRTRSPFVYLISAAYSKAFENTYSVNTVLSNLLKYSAARTKKISYVVINAKYWNEAKEKGFKGRNFKQRTSSANSILEEEYLIKNLKNKASNTLMDYQTKMNKEGVKLYTSKFCKDLIVTSGYIEIQGTLKDLNDFCISIDTKKMMAPNIYNKVVTSYCKSMADYVDEISFTAMNSTERLAKKVYVTIPNLLNPQSLENSVDSIIFYCFRYKGLMDERVRNFSELLEMEKILRVEKLSGIDKYNELYNILNFGKGSSTKEFLLPKVKDMSRTLESFISIIKKYNTKTSTITNVDSSTKVIQIVNPLSKISPYIKNQYSLVLSSKEETMLSLLFQVVYYHTFNTTKISKELENLNYDGTNVLEFFEDEMISATVQSKLKSMRPELLFLLSSLALIARGDERNTIRVNNSMAFFKMPSLSYTMQLEFGHKMKSELHTTESRMLKKNFYSDNFVMCLQKGSLQSRIKTDKRYGFEVNDAMYTLSINKFLNDKERYHMLTKMLNKIRLREHKDFFSEKGDNGKKEGYILVKRTLRLVTTALNLQNVLKYVTVSTAVDSNVYDYVTEEGEIVKKCTFNQEKGKRETVIGYTEQKMFIATPNLKFSIGDTEKIYGEGLGVELIKNNVIKAHLENQYMSKENFIKYQVFLTKKSKFSDIKFGLEVFDELVFDKEESFEDEGYSSDEKDLVEKKNSEGSEEEEFLIQDEEKTETLSVVGTAGEMKEATERIHKLNLSLEEIKEKMSLKEKLESETQESYTEKMDFLTTERKEIEKRSFTISSMVDRKLRLVELGGLLNNITKDQTTSLSMWPIFYLERMYEILKYDMPGNEMVCATIDCVKKVTMFSYKGITRTTVNIYDEDKTLVMKLQRKKAELKINQDDLFVESELDKEIFEWVMVKTIEMDNVLLLKKLKEYVLEYFEWSKELKPNDMSDQLFFSEYGDNPFVAMIVFFEKYLEGKRKEIQDWNQQMDEEENVYLKKTKK